MDKFLSEALLEIARDRSETTFIEVGEDKELIDAAKKVGISLPSPDFLVMKTIYAEVDKQNLNGVVLPKEAVDKGLKTLIGKQCNWEHDGKGRICGFTISAKRNGDKIETINVLFKSLYSEEIAELREKIKTKEAAVSFEIWNRNPETGESVVTELADGSRAINPIIFHGTGVLLVNPPACPKAKIFKMIGSKELIDAERIIEKVFEEDLICASQAIEQSVCKNCNSCTCKNEGGDIIMEEIQANNVEKVEETQVTPEPAQVVEPAAAPIVEATPVPEPAQVVEQPVEPKKITRVIREDSEICVDVEGVCQRKRHLKMTTEYSDGTNEIVEEDSDIVTRYTQAEVEVKIAEAKAEVIAAKDAEIKTLQEIKDKEIATKQQELEKVSQELASIKVEKAKVVEAQPDLEVGSAATKGMDAVIERRKKINMKAYGHDNQGR